MRVIYDWRLARVVDEEDQIIDELFWNRISTKNLVDRLSDLQSGRITPEARTLMERFPDAEKDSLGALSYSEWPELSDEETKKFIEASTRLAKRGVAESSGDIDRRMDMLVSANNEIRSSWTTLEARCIEWTGLFLSDLDLDEQRKEIPEIVSRSKSINDVANEFNVSEPKHQPSEEEWNTITSQAQLVVNLANQITSSENTIRTIANDYLPSLSALMGPISAAKLVVLAGGRERLARMPSGSCLLYTSPSPRDRTRSRMPSSA